MKYFAYSDDLHLARLKKLIGGARVAPTGLAYLQDTKMVFPRYSKSWGGGIASFSEGYGNRLWGAVFELKATQLKTMDGQVGAAGNKETDPYTRVKIDITSKEGKTIRGVYAYKANVEVAQYYPPSERYLKVIESGVKECGLPGDYVAEIRNMIAKL